MADTLKTQAQLLTELFVDGQVDGSITAQDMRNLIISLTPAIGAIYFSTPVETIIASPGAPVLALGTTTLTSEPHGIDMPQNNRLRYTEVVPRHFIIDCAISSTTAANNKVIEYQIYKNGIALPETLITKAHGTGSDYGALAITTNLHMMQNDYIELFITNITDSSNITIENGTINLVGFVVE